MGTANIVPASAESPPRRDWLDATIRLATSWVGLSTAYLIALVAGAAEFDKFEKILNDRHVPLWLAIIVVAAVPLIAFVSSTIPKFLDQRRIKRYSEITGALQTGYFTLRPREDEEHFDRADNAQQEILRWIENTKEPVLYLTGASGTGKSSLLSAWVIPKLKREKHVVIQLRGYEDDFFARIKDELSRPGAIWDKAPGKTDDLRLLLERAALRLGDRRLLIVVDQFEEFLILKDQDRQSRFREFLVEKPTGGVTFLLVYRPEYEGLIQDLPWPKLKLDTNRRVIGAFTENAAQEFMRKSGLTVNANLMRAALREAAEIEQTTGLIRPVTINLCGLVLSRFASGLPRRFRGGLIRGFLRESLSLPEVRDVAGRLIPQLITDNVTKQPRTIADLARTTVVASSAVRAFLRRLGESDRAIVRPLDPEQEIWEISHDFLVPLLDSIVARRTVSWWRAFRPWLPWTAAAVMGIAAVAIPLMTKQSLRNALIAKGWAVSEARGPDAGPGALLVARQSPIPPNSIAILSGLPPRSTLILSGTKVTDLSALRELKNLTRLILSVPLVTDISALRGLKNLTMLDLQYTSVTDVSALRELQNLTELHLYGTKVTDVSALRELKKLTSLDLSVTNVRDVSSLRELTKLTRLDLSNTQVTDVSALRELQNLKWLNLGNTQVTDVSALRELQNLTWLSLGGHTPVKDVSALRELKNLTELYLTGTNVTDVSALRELKNLKIIR